MSNSTSAPTESGLPLAVQIAFAGSRELFNPVQNPALDSDDFTRATREILVERLARLTADLNLTTRHRPCGISSLASGADLLFSAACKTLAWPQRVFLPQPPEQFLSAEGSKGPDFTPESKKSAQAFLSSPHVIEQRVASVSGSRHTRFEDVNLEMVRVSDVVVCLFAVSGTGSSPGGTRDVLELANRTHRPVLELRLTVGPESRPVFDEQWHWNPPPDAPEGRKIGFVPPTLPAPLDQIECADCDFFDPSRYRKTLKDFASRKAAEKQNSFVRIAIFIVAAHVIATALALWAVLHHSPIVPWILGVELAFLATGLAFHEWLHRSHAGRHWALARLAAEVARSVIPLATVPRSLRHLFELPMPDHLRPLLRTLNVLHLSGLRSVSPENWEARRDNYVSTRLRAPKSGQIDYYEKKILHAKQRLKLARAAFFLGSLGALVATICKLGVTLHWVHIESVSHDSSAAICGYLAVFLPVVAVAALSLAAAFDLEAREHTYSDTLAFLKKQTPLLESAKTENEFATLALETESRLLGETANWHARRAFTGVA